MGVQGESRKVAIGVYGGLGRGRGGEKWECECPGLEVGRAGSRVREGDQGIRCKSRRYSIRSCPNGFVKQQAGRRLTVAKPRTSSTLDTKGVAFAVGKIEQQLNDLIAFPAAPPQQNYN